MEILDNVILFLATFMGTALVIRLIIKYNEIGKEIEEEKRKKENEKDTRHN